MNKVEVRYLCNFSDLDAQSCESLSKPIIFKDRAGACKNIPAYFKWSGSHGLDYLKEKCGSAFVQVYVLNINNCVLTSSDGLFNGKMQYAESKLLTFGDMIHEFTLSPNCKLYLAQSSMYCKSNDGSANLKPLLDDFPIPIIRDDKLNSINLWMASRSGSVSNLHFDAFHNFLCLISGSKQVLLAPASATSYLTQSTAWCTTANHSSMSLLDSDFIKSNFALSSLIEVADMQAGDVLFIPEGYWHQVVSTPLTISVNVWFDSDFTTKCIDNKMRPYYLMRILREEIWDKRNTLLEDVKGDDFLLSFDNSVSCREYTGNNDIVPNLIPNLYAKNFNVHVDHLLDLSVREVMALVTIQDINQKKKVMDLSQVYKALGPKSTKSVLFFLSKHMPIALTETFRNLTMTSTAVLINFFESDEFLSSESEDDFFQSLYATIDDKIGLQQQLTKYDESFSKHALHSLFQLDNT